MASNTIRLAVTGMKCEKMCGSKVRAALQSVDGVEDVRVNVAEGLAVVTSARANFQDFKGNDVYVDVCCYAKFLIHGAYLLAAADAIEKAGHGRFQVTEAALASAPDQLGASRRSSTSSNDSVDAFTPNLALHAKVPVPAETPLGPPSQFVFKLDGLTCASCIETVTNHLKEHRAIQDVNVNLERAIIVAAAPVNAVELRDWIQEIGYGADLVSSAPVQPSQSQNANDDRKSFSRTLS